MPSGRERPAREQETLIYSSPEQAQGLRERVRERLQRESQPVRRDREMVAEVVADEFAAAGHAVEPLKTPWSHTEEEHTEAQQLVDIAFAKDLSAALKAARSSPHFPRNLDLFHDVLTSEMYELVHEQRLNKQPLGVWVLFVVGVVLVAMLVSAGLLIAV